MSFSKRIKSIKGNAEELGFGSRIINQTDRMLNKDGSFNVRRKGLSFH